jgi:hypothetical protein
VQWETFQNDNDTRFPVNVKTVKGFSEEKETALCSGAGTAQKQKLFWKEFKWKGLKVSEK